MTGDINRTAVMTGRSAGRAHMDLEYVTDDFGGGNFKALQTERHIYTIKQGGSPFFDGFVTEKAREALRSFSGFLPCF